MVNLMLNLIRKKHRYYRSKKKSHIFVKFLSNNKIFYDDIDLST